ncbi:MULTISPECIES: DUF6401 family natural product biosynthesis protein [Nocardia]|uniref:DUF6401 family natural product biosynthesis protein n=1 Tax=Nocardia TaxID=1817 RepID=UPI0018962593|nr:MULTISPECIES: DUF6401 family natural product biosynthesis protein [Nocardia]MBF6350601.1 hypothetical protein [Nocardia flavorosea]
MFALGPRLFEISARRFLEGIQQTHGAPARAAATALPGLSAEIDQHAAAVRDILDLGVASADQVPAPVLLAGYIRGLLAELTAPITEPADWATAEWLHLRLAGACLHSTYGVAAEPKIC